MTDDEFLSAFEHCQLPSLSHRDHLRIAWLTLQRQALLPAIGRLQEGFKRFAESKCQPEMYHETITWAFTILIHERINRGLGGSDYREFIELNPDLLQGTESLAPFYDRDLLFSSLARETFVFPGPASAVTSASTN